MAYFFIAEHNPTATSNVIAVRRNRMPIRNWCHRNGNKSTFPVSKDAAERIKRRMKIGTITVRQALHV